MAILGRESRLTPSETPNHWRPVLRGARATYYSDFEQDPHYDYYREIRCDGLVETGLVHCGLASEDGRLDLSEGFLLVFLANALTQAHRVRAEAGAPTAEYGIDVQIAVVGSTQVRVVSGEDPVFGRSKTLGVDREHLPRYSLGSADEIPFLLGACYQDLWDSLGVAVDAEQFSIPGWSPGENRP